MTDNENASDKSPGGYEKPDVVNSERPPVTHKSDRKTNDKV